MANLSPEDRRRIYEEEKFRLETQQQIKAEHTSSTGKKIGIGCVAVIVGLLILFAIGSMMENDESARFQALTPEQRRAETVKNCIELEKSFAFKTYSEMSQDERKVKLSCDLELSDK